MKILFQNVTKQALKIVVEPSKDELLLKHEDVLTIFTKYDTESPLEVHYFSDSMVVLMAHGQSADFYINDKEVETMCSQSIW